MDFQRMRRFSSLLFWNVLYEVFIAHSYNACLFVCFFFCLIDVVPWTCTALLDILLGMYQLKLKHGWHRKAIGWWRYTGWQLATLLEKGSKAGMK